MRTLVGLSLAPEHRRGHGALYDGLSAGRVDIARLRWSLAALPVPAWPDGRVRLAADVSNWLRPDAGTSPERLFCHCYGRAKGQAQMIPGWPYSVIAALEPGSTSWTAPLDAVRLGPEDDETEVTAAQVRGVVTRLIGAGHWREGDLPILVVFDAGYDVTRLSYLLAGLPVELVGRLRSDRVLYFPAPARSGGRGRPARHGSEFKLAAPGTWPGPAVTTTTETARYGTAVAQSWDRLHPRLTHRAAWAGQGDGELPILDGTLIRLNVDHLPGDRDPRPVWLWCSATGLAATEVDRCWQAFLRRFDLEAHLPAVQAGPRVGRPQDPRPAGGRPLDLDHHRLPHPTPPRSPPRRRPAPPPLGTTPPPRRLTPARVRRGFRNIRLAMGCPAGAPKPGTPGPGRPPGSKNRHPAARHGVGKHGKTNPAQKIKG